MKKYLFQLLTVVVFLSGCSKDFLARRIDTTYSEDDIFASYSRMRDFAYGIYTYLPQGFDRIDNAMLAAASDEAAHAWVGGTIQRLNNGSWGPDSNPEDQWTNYYTAIRKANLFLEKSGNYKAVLMRDTITLAGKTEFADQTNDIMWLRAEARFLRALFYFELVKRYGGVPLIKKTLSLDNDLLLPRNTLDECVSFIVSECNLASDTLRLTWKGFSSDSKTGRATKGTALALKSRMLLYAASPLNNTTNDVSKWQQAAEAARAVIALNQYTLNSSYADLFKSFTSNEIIFERRNVANNSVERFNYPIGFDGAVGGVNPTQNLVDAYETKNGLDITADATYNPQNPYANRDPRLTMTLIVNNATFKSRPVEAWKGGLDGEGKARATRTGYYLRKYLYESVDLVTNTTATHTWILFRYAEVLLNYAEAMNEAYGPDVVPTGYTLSARQAINLVRKRTGVAMPDVIAANQTAFRAKVWNERRVELAFEEHRYWDARRWKTGNTMLGIAIKGVGIVKNPDNTFTYQYNVPVVEQRTFSDKMYLYPIPRVEIAKSSGTLVQNPGW